MEDKKLVPRQGKDLPIDQRLSMLTCALFFEWRHNSSCEVTPPFCLKPYDWENNGVLYKSMYLLFMQYDTEYAAAMGILGSWPHWQKLRECKWFKKELNKWLDEMRLRDEALAKEKLVELTKANNVTAAKTLLSESKIERASRGRPSKKTKAEQMQRTPQSDDLDSLLAHASRVKDE